MPSGGKRPGAGRKSIAKDRNLDFARQPLAKVPPAIRDNVKFKILRVLLASPQRKGANGGKPFGGILAVPGKRGPKPAPDTRNRDALNALAFVRLFRERNPDTWHSPRDKSLAKDLLAKSDMEIVVWLLHRRIEAGLMSHDHFVAAVSAARRSLQKCRHVV